MQRTMPAILPKTECVSSFSLLLHSLSQTPIFHQHAALSSCMVRLFFFHTYAYTNRNIPSPSSYDIHSHNCILMLPTAREKTDARRVLRYFSVNNPLRVTPSPHSLRWWRLLRVHLRNPSWRKHRHLCMQRILQHQQLGLPGHERIVLRRGTYRTHR